MIHCHSHRSFGWSIRRDLPPASDHGGPLCEASATVPLAAESRGQLLDVLSGVAASAQLLRRGSGGAGGSAALYPLLWLLRGDICVSNPMKGGLGLEEVCVPRIGGREGVAGLLWLWRSCQATCTKQEARPHTTGAQ